jgi:hypothetical protein
MSRGKRIGDNLFAVFVDPGCDQHGDPERADYDDNR